MDLETAVTVALVLIALNLALARPSFPKIPGPTLRDYLPGGLAFTLNWRPGSALDAVLQLSRRYGPVFQVRLGATRTVFVVDPADIAHVVSSADDFERAPSITTAFDVVLPRSLFTMPREEHLAARRRLRENFNHSLLPDFHVPMLQAVAEIAEELRAAAVAQAAEKGAATTVSPVDINNVVSTATTRIILNVALGGDMTLPERKAFAKDMDSLMRELVQEWMQYPVRQMVVMFGTRKKLLNHRRSIDAVARNLIEKRLAETPSQAAARSPDLLDAILALDGHDMPRLVAEVSAFVIAGAHTVSVAISYALLHVMCNPGVSEKLTTEIDTVISARAAQTHADTGDGLTREETFRMGYLHNVWKEALRLSSPAWALIRRTRREVTLNGTERRLPTGTQVGALLHGAHRSELHFDDAEEFIPERWGTNHEGGDAGRVPPGAYLPFGAGQRACAGQFLADSVGPLVIAELLRRFSFELSCPAEDICNITGFVAVPRWSSKGDGVFDMGVPVIVRDRL